MTVQEKNDVNGLFGLTSPSNSKSVMMEALHLCNTSTLDVMRRVKEKERKQAVK